MKQIEPIQIWDNGKTQNAEILNVYAVNVTLGTSANFYYSLMSDTKQTLATGNLTMSGDEYEKWSDSDDYAWDFVATKLNLVIIGDWVEPIVEVDKTAEKLNSDFPLFDALIESEIVKESLTVEPIEPIVEPIVLTTDMKVGMGITDPSAKLEVTGPIVEDDLTVVSA